MKRFEPLSWLDIKHHYANQLSPTIVNAISAAAPPNDDTIYLARYDYGDIIYDNNTWYYPEKSQQKDIPQDLRYCPLPLGMVLNHGAEQFIPHPTQLRPLQVMTPGHWVGLQYNLPQLSSSVKTKTMAINHNMTITAGARSLCLLPSLNHQTCLKQLYHTYQCPKRELNHPSQQWYLFKHLYHRATMPWTCDIIWFPQQWLSHPPFQHILYHQGWQQSILPSQLLHLEQWLAQVLSQYLKLSPYLMATLKHLFAIAQGIYPGFRPQGNSEQLAPIYTLQQLLLNAYPLPYLPTLLAPSHVTATRPVYYSCHMPTLITPHRKAVSHRYMDFLRQMASILEKLSKDTLSPLPSTTADGRDPLPIKDWERGLFPIITAFHTYVDPLKVLKSSEMIPKEDNAFLEEQAQYSDLPFCVNSHFFKGCFRIEKHSGYASMK